ncbi:GLUG motif-containing protein [Aneurinibacillus soli]|uniref:The GLUG motif protein n=1 Tax=Aneurinibacillus soli TaxID=1500254 RepID=A0A0U4NH71_9BACL|nr:GLUG motif-containing protein [Aneurinibacillus soli]PYE64135.1 GLUG motif-containing protein [Aneurinibacillus soli]BAU28084.1 The GLUG motif protein [Aneurinibacillus soli]
MPDHTNRQAGSITFSLILLICVTIISLSLLPFLSGENLRTKRTEVLAGVEASGKAAAEYIAYSIKKQLNKSKNIKLVVDPKTGTAFFPSTISLVSDTFLIGTLQPNVNAITSFLGHKQNVIEIEQQEVPSFPPLFGPVQDGLLYRYPDIQISFVLQSDTESYHSRASVILRNLAFQKNGMDSAQLQDTYTVSIENWELKNTALTLHSFTCSDVPEGWKCISSADDVRKIGTSSDMPLDGKYFQINDINLSSISEWTPIGTESAPFTGSYNGNSFVINSLTINQPTHTNQGLFGYVSGGTITNVQLENVHIIAKENAGGLIGTAASASLVRNSTVTGYDPSIININGEKGLGGLIGLQKEKSLTDQCYASVGVKGADHAGGLIGENHASTVIQSHASGKVEVIYNGSYTSGTQFSGGLVGGNNESGLVSHCYADTEVYTTTGKGGGLVGGNRYSTIQYSHASGSVSASDTAGGLVGYGENSLIHNSYSTGAVTVRDHYAGGLVGFQKYGSSIYDSYASGTVRGGGDYIGGLVGAQYGNYMGGSVIENTYASGRVEGRSYVGGLLGYAGDGASEAQLSSIRRSYALNSSVSGTSHIGKIVGAALNSSVTMTDLYCLSTMTGGHINYATSSITPEQAVTQAPYEAYTLWDFGNVWSIKANSYPALNP